jgi:hypothetical protein
VEAPTAAARTLHVVEIQEAIVAAARKSVSEAVPVSPHS